MLVKLHNIDNKQVVSQREHLYDLFSLKIKTVYGIMLKIEAARHETSVREARGSK